MLARLRKVLVPPPVHGDRGFAANGVFNFFFSHRPQRAMARARSG